MSTKTTQERPRERHFAHPFVHLVSNGHVMQYCSHCMRQPAGQALTPCDACQFSRYCSLDCQKAAWTSHHRLECARLQASFPKLPLTEVLLMARTVSRVRRLESGDTALSAEVERDRAWRDLMSHAADIRADPLKYAVFEKIYEKTRAFIAGGTTGADEMPDKEEFLEWFGRVWINSHSVGDMRGGDIGTALDLGVSAYDHSCYPNATLAYDGYVATLRALGPEVDLYDIDNTHFSYVEVIYTKYLRHKYLWNNWLVSKRYFTCACSRCTSDWDTLGTALCCANAQCDAAIPASETAEPDELTCAKCSTRQNRQRVAKAIELMRAQPLKMNTGDADCLQIIRQQLQQAELLLYRHNLLRIRLLTAYTQAFPDDQYSNPDNHKLAYDVYKRIMHPHHRHRGYQILHLIRSLVLRGDRAAAKSYAEEVAGIFEWCFGAGHDYHGRMLTLADKLSQDMFQVPVQQLWQLMSLE